MIRVLWLLCVAATIWFALIPASMGGLGGAGYHGVAFFVLGLLTPAAFPRIQIAFIWLGLLALGGGIELAQGLMTERRQGEWGDFFTDAVAATVGVIYYRIWVYLNAGKAPKDTSADEDTDAPSADSES